MNNHYMHKGMFTLYCGPMFSSKSQLLLTNASKFKHIPDFEYLLIKPELDKTRSSQIITRMGEVSEKCILANNSYSIIQLIEKNKLKLDAILIDEINMFDNEISDVVKYLLKKNIAIYGAGLDLDFKGDPFETMKNLMPIADYIEKLTAICKYDKCGRPANRTQRLIDGIPAPYDSDLFIVADETALKNKVTYEARCLKHHEVPGKPEKYSIE